MISMAHRFIFVHVPRTGGNAVQNILVRYSEDKIVADRPHQDGVERFGICGAIPGLVKHSTLPEIEAALGPNKMGAYRIAVTQRNPFDRAISHYFFKHSMPFFRQQTTPGNTGIEFDDEVFIEMVSKLKPMRLFIGDGWNCPLTIQHVSRITWLLRFENLAADLNDMLADLDLPGADLPKRNASFRNKHYREYYTAAGRAAVEEHFGDELELFGYEF